MLLNGIALRRAPRAAAAARRFFRLRRYALATLNEIPSASASDSELAPAVWLGLLLSTAALLRTLWLLRTASARLGPTLHAEEPRSLPRALRLALVAGAIAALAATWREQGDALAPGVALVGVLAALAILTPSSDSQRVGEHGVRRGFDVRRFEELEEWRLTGEHLRWRLDGEWTACRLPVEQHAAMRAKLVALNPTRESRFN